ncbi:preprotein translocase subunit SecE [Candidatus Dependentiae bacterium]|nr:preprotein translocase subunit SecE [Candidatus Dependentiae bacterium]
MKNLGLFFKEVKIELSKVIWPKREEFIGAIIVVMIVLVAFTIFFGVVNYILQSTALKGFQFLVFGRS